jgi:membrane protease YdiL (CAAX protease family)
MTRVVHVTLGLVVAVIGAVVLFQSVTGLSFQGANDEPGPGFFPALLAGLLIFLGLALSLGWLLAPRTRLENLEELTFARPALLRAGGVWLSLAIGVALLTTLGFLLSSILIVALLVLGMEQLRGLRTIAAMLALPIGIYVVFSVLLEVRLPAGVFGS